MKMPDDTLHSQLFKAIDRYDRAASCMSRLVVAVDALDKAAITHDDGRRRCYSLEHLAECIDDVKKAYAEYLAEIAKPADE